MTIDVARIAFAQREYRATPPIEDAFILDQHPLAVELSYNTLFRNESDASNFGTYVLGLRKLDRWTWTCYLNKRNYPNLEIGQTIRIVYPRFGLAGGADFIVKRLKRDSGALFHEVTLFGPRGRVYPDEALALDFQRRTYWRNGAEIAHTAVPGYSYTRTGGKAELSGFGKTLPFAANIPGIVPGVGYWSRPQLTNSLLHSQDLPQAAWTKLNVTISSNVATAPDGTLSADRVLETSATGNHQVYQSFSKASSALTYTDSVFVKPAGRDWVELVLFDNTNLRRMWFNIKDKTIGSMSGAGFTLVDRKIIDVGSGWVRLVLSFTTPATNNVFFYTNPASADGVFSYAGNAALGIDVWQAQRLLGIHADGGPLIATGASAVTVNADNMIMDNALSDQAQIFMASANFLQYNSTVTTYLAAFGPTASNMVALIQGSNTFAVNVISGGSQVFSQSVAPAFTGPVTLFAVRSGGTWRAGMVRDKVLSWFGTATSAAFIASPGTAKLLVGQHPSVANHPNVPIGKVLHRLGAFTEAQILEMAA